MGVSGVGKTTVGELLAQRLGLPYRDGDDLHSAEAKQKMAAGVPLTDDDRWPWLERVGAWLAEHATGGAVTGCSALRRSYRDVLRAAAPGVRFLYLSAPPELLRERMEHRLEEGRHFMPTDLLASQLATLEPPAPDEDAVEVEATGGPEAAVDA
ncbi:MAG: gluconokinase, partial [Actinomycetales bacterium]